MSKFHIHANQDGSDLRDVVFGFNDGLVSTFAFVAGLIGASIASHTLIFVGIIEAMSAAFSMGVGAYLSTKSQNEFFFEAYLREQIAMKENLRDRHTALVGVFREMGLPKTAISSVMAGLRRKKETVLRILVEHSTGMTKDHVRSPVRAGVVMFLGFVVGAVIPLFPFLFFGTSAFMVSIVASLAGAFGMGAGKTRITGRPWLESGFETMGLALVLMVVSYGTGFVINQLVGLSGSVG